jgi:hypothetical protein
MADEHHMFIAPGMILQLIYFNFILLANAYKQLGWTTRIISVMADELIQLHMFIAPGRGMILQLIYFNFIPDDIHVLYSRMFQH